MTYVEHKDGLEFGWFRLAHHARRVTLYKALRSNWYVWGIFNSEEEAKEYLVKRAQMYYDEFEGQVDQHLQDIEKHGMLTIDAVTARIDEIEED